MARKKSSCLKRLAIGCGGLVLCFILLGFALFVSASLNKPLPAERKQFAVSESFGGNQETNLSLPDGSERAKPIVLKLDLAMLEFRIEPFSGKKSIEIESDYDQANFDLETKVIEKDDHLVYEVRFKNKRTLLGMLLSKGSINDQDINNKVVVKIPHDLLVAIDFKMEMGKADLNLSGLAISKLKADFSMGEFLISMDEANQVAMTDFLLLTGMGETRVNDFQNLRFKQGKVQSSMGEVRLRNSGDLIEPAELILKITMGEMRVDVPPNANLKANSAVVFGESTRRGKSPAQPDGPELKIDASVTFGNMNLNQSYSRSPLRGRILRLIREEGIDAAIADYQSLKKNRAAYFDFRPTALNRIGYSLLGKDQYEDAIRIFQLNVEVYPHYANGYDSLGEAFMKAGKRKEALENYQKSWEMDPSNDNAMEMIEILRMEESNPEGEPNNPEEK